MPGEDDLRFKFLHRLVLNAFRHLPVEKLNDYWLSDTNKRVIGEFLEAADTQAIFVRESKNSIEVSDSPLRNPKGLSFYFAKLVKGPVSEARITQDILYGDVTADPLEHLLSLAKKVYNPIVDCDESGVAWSEAIAKDVRENFDTFVANVQITQGHCRGITCLPLPNSFGQKREIGNSIDPSEKQETQYQIHALESAIITWTKQIKNILKQDPESVLLKQVHPGPSAEIEFWK
eukprot:gene59149-78926_t